MNDPQNLIRIHAAIRSYKNFVDRFHSGQTP